MPAKLRFLHPGDSLNEVKLSFFRRFTTDALIASLQLGQPGCLKTRPDGTVLDGHHRLTILIERSVSVEGLPREIIQRQDDAL